MKYILSLFAALLLCSQTAAQEPATEIRAVWLTTNWGLDWPKKGKSVEEQKQELLAILDEFQKDHFNVVLFQVRAQGQVFYKSLIEKMSPYFNSKDGFDPLKFVIEAAHERNMECHAWITTFPVEKVKLSKWGKLLEKRPDYYKQVDDRWFLDPGRPETRDRLVLIAKEIVTGYDVDGLHLDYIRYPDNPKTFDDKNTYRLYGKGKDKTQWRRDNVTKIVFDIYDAVKSVKDWVQVSSSPLGKYKAIKRNDGWTAYESVLQDAGYWISEGKQDLLFPMMYGRGNDFFPYVDEWLATSNGRHIIPGLGAYQMEENERNWGVKELTDQMTFTREKEVQGQAYFRANQVLNNKKGLRDAIQALYKYPAKLPAMTWLSDSIPSHPLKFEVYKDEDNNLVMKWQAPDNNGRYTYNVYFGNEDDLDHTNAAGILVANLHRTEFSFPASVGEYGFYYFVTASDRYHNESESAESIYFVHSEEEH